MRMTWRAVTLAAITVAPHHVYAAYARTSETPIRPESRLWITGASNLRRFTCKASRLSGAVELQGVATRRPVLLGDNVSTRPSLSVSVDRLDCGIGVMNHHLRDALHGTEHPVVEFRLGRYEVDLSAPVPVARISGQLTIGGVQRPVTITAAVRADTLGMLRLQGAYRIRPTEFGVAPPRRFAGLLRVRDRVTVHFDLALDPYGGTAHDLRRALMTPAAADPPPEPTHDSHQ